MRITAWCVFCWYSEKQGQINTEEIHSADIFRSIFSQRWCRQLCRIRFSWQIFLPRYADFLGCDISVYTGCASSCTIMCTAPCFISASEIGCKKSLLTAQSGLVLMFGHDRITFHCSDVAHETSWSSQVLFEMFLLLQVSIHHISYLYKEAHFCHIRKNAHNYDILRQLWD